MTDDSFDYIGYYLIVVTALYEDGESIAKNVFSDLWSLKIVNVNLLSFVDIFNRSVMYTFRPYSSQKCESTEPVVFNRYEHKSFVREKSHWPNKLKNFHKCPLYLSTYHLDPYMLLIERNDSTNYFTDGIDGIVFRVIGQRLNFTPIVISMPFGHLGDCSSCLVCECDELTVSSPALNLVNCFE